MRLIGALALACGFISAAAVWMAAPTLAQDACKASPNQLGVSREIEIDTTGGPRFGFQYKEQDLLADGEVVLSFDDGPLRSHTKVILDALDAQCTKATFFSVGR